MTISSRTIITQLKASGWYKVSQTGSHVQFKHPTKRGRVTVQHPRTDMPIGTQKSIERQAGMRFK